MLSRKFSLAFFAATALGTVAHGATCVTNVSQFQSALTAAQDQSGTSEIRVAQGNYALGSTSLSFAFVIAGLQGPVIISGGWDGTCATQTQNPALTVLDGQNQANGVLNLASAGDLTVQFLTIENGVATSGVAGGLGVSFGAAVTIDHDIITGNTAPTNAGLYIAATADVHLDNNLIYANTVTGNTGAEAGAGRVASNAAIYATNNTVADNILANSANGNVGGLKLLSGPVTLSNNIGWGDTNYDFDVSQVSSGVETFVDNDYEVLKGTPGGGGNLTVDPQFVGSGDYHLTFPSPVIGQGTIAPAGGLQTVDLDGMPRTYAGKVDMGAYESDVIFANGFDP